MGGMCALPCLLVCSLVSEGCVVGWLVACCWLQYLILEHHRDEEAEEGRLNSRDRLLHSLVTHLR